jgi:hypothetical protein
LKRVGMHIWSSLNVALGALSFLMLLSGMIFWVGFACAAAALILGTIGKKSPLRSKRVCAVLGIILAVAGAAFFVAVLYSAGIRYKEIL